MPIFGARTFTLNQYLGSMNYDMDKNSISRVHKPEKRKIVELDVGLQTFWLNIWGPKTLDIIFRGQQRNSGMDW